MRKIALEIQKQINTLRIWSSASLYTTAWPDGSYLELSENPFHPLGIYRHGEGAENSYPSQAIDFKDLPRDCQEAVILECSGAMLAKDLAKIDEESGEDSVEGGQSV